MQRIIAKRIYEPRTEADGYRILVDRLWPRGVTKADAAVDEWMKDVAPSTDLRKWFHSDAGNWEQFRQKYFSELKDNPAVKELSELAKKHKTVTLLYSVKDEINNHANALKEYLEGSVR